MSEKEKVIYMVNTKKKYKIYFSVFALVLLAVISVVCINAAKVDDYKDNSKVQEYLDKIANYNKQEQDTKNNIAALGNDIESIMLEKEGYDKLIEVVEGKILMSETYSKEIAAEITKLNREITTKEEECAKLYEEIKQRMRISYENSDMSYIAMFLGAESLTEFLIAIDNAASILEYDSRMLQTYETKKTELETAKASHEASKEALDALLAQLALDKTNLDELVVKCETLLSDKMTALGNEKELLAALEDSKEKFAKELDAYIEELEKKNGITQVVSEGEFIWPVPVTSTRVTSGFGYRTDPFTGKKAYHSGIDIADKKGTPIFASNHGTVLIATNDGSYGKYILIDHGGGVYTLYAHCNKLLVSAGDKVKKGDKIAEMGTTGRSTGNHLHFEVREGKNRVDPFNYVTKP